MARLLPDAQREDVAEALMAKGHLDVDVGGIGWITKRCIYIYIYSITHISLYIYIDIHIYICVSICMCICMYVYVYIYISIEVPKLVS